MVSKEYVRLTYRPAGARRRQTVWAVVVHRGPKTTTYKQVSAEGDEYFPTGKFQGGVEVEEVRLIVTTPEEATEKPARMSLVYAALEEIQPPRAVCPKK